MGIMLERWHPLDGAPATLPSFLDAVKSRLEPHTPPPDGIVEDVLAVLAQRTRANFLPTLSAHMPAELQPQWRAAVEAAPPE